MSKNKKMISVSLSSQSLIINNVITNSIIHLKKLSIKSGEKLEELDKKIKAFRFNGSIIIRKIQ